MSLNLPRPSQTYEPVNEAQTRNTLAQADAQNVKKTDDIVIDPGRNKLILIDTDGARWSITVGTDGTITATAL